MTRVRSGAKVRSPAQVAAGRELVAPCRKTRAAALAFRRQGDFAEVATSASEGLRATVVGVLAAQAVATGERVEIDPKLFEG